MDKTLIILENKKTFLKIWNYLVPDLINKLYTSTGLY